MGIETRVNKEKTYNISEQRETRENIFFMYVCQRVSVRDVVNEIQLSDTMRQTGRQTDSQSKQQQTKLYLLISIRRQRECVCGGGGVNLKETL